jgi:hypothetical protein
MGDENKRLFKGKTHGRELLEIHAEGDRHRELIDGLRALWAKTRCSA